MEAEIFSRLAISFIVGAEGMELLYKSRENEIKVNYYDCGLFRPQKF